MSPANVFREFFRLVSPRDSGPPKSSPPKSSAFLSNVNILNPKFLRADFLLAGETKIVVHSGLKSSRTQICKTARKARQVPNYPSHCSLRDAPCRTVIVSGLQGRQMESPLTLHGLQLHGDSWKLLDTVEGPKLLQKTSLQKQYLEAVIFVIITNTLCIQLKKTRERPQKHYKNNCFRELFYNNIGQDGKILKGHP